MLNFYDFIQVFVFTTNHHLNVLCIYTGTYQTFSTFGPNEEDSEIT